MCARELLQLAGVGFAQHESLIAIEEHRNLVFYIIFSLVSSLIDHISLSKPHELPECKRFQLPLSIGYSVQKFLSKVINK